MNIDCFFFSIYFGCRASSKEPEERFTIRIHSTTATAITPLFSSDNAPIQILIFGIVKCISFPISSGVSFVAIQISVFKTTTVHPVYGKSIVFKKRLNNIISSKFEPLVSELF